MAADVIHWTEDGQAPRCKSPGGEGHSLAWFARSVTCPDCLALVNDDTEV